MEKIDKTDILILKELQRDADRTIYQIAKQTGLKRSTVYSRIKRLKENKIIQGYTALIDYGKIGRPIRAMVLIRHKKTTDVEALFKDIAKEEEVEAIYPITGGFDVMIKARFKDIGDISAFILKKLSKPAMASKILRTETIMTLGAFKEYFRKS